MRTVLLLLISSIFMTFARYGHLKFRQAPLTLGIFASGGIAVFEYCFPVPANRWNYAASFGCMVAAVSFAFRF